MPAWRMRKPDRRLFRAVALCGHTCQRRFGRRRFLGAHATVTKDVIVGPHAKLAAGAVAYNDIPESANALGNPARFRGKPFEPFSSIKKKQRGHFGLIEEGASRSKTTPSQIDFKGPPARFPGRLRPTPYLGMRNIALLGLLKRDFRI